MPFPLLAMGAMAAGSAISGALNNRSRTTKTRSQSTTTPTFSPEFSPLIGQLSGSVMDQMRNPAAGMEPIRLATRDRINRTFGAAPDAIAAKTMTGGGRSGKFGRGIAMSEAGRLGSLADAEAQFAQLVLQRQASGQDLATRLLALGKGQTTQGTGEQTTPGNMLGGAVGGGLETASYLFALNNMLKGGGMGMGNT
jgi:hypothetical protein